MRIKLFEYLDLKKDIQNNKLIVFSDWNTVKETFWNKQALQSAGFTFDRDIKSWTMPVDQMDKAVAALNQINSAIQGKAKSDTIKDKKKEIITGLEHFKDWISDQDIPATKGKELDTKIDMYIKDLANATDEAALNAEVRRFMEFSSKFYNYSFGNRLLIYIQKRNAAQVAGAKQWEKKLFRRLVKGAQPIWIWCASKTNGSAAPKTNDVDDDEGKEDTAGMLDRLISGGGYSNIRFTPCRVFDISDTEPIDERGEKPEIPQWYGDNTPNETAEMLTEILTNIIKNESIKVTRDVAKQGEKGFASMKGDHINVSADVEGEGAISTLTHEFAHMLMHINQKSPFYIDVSKMMGNPNQLRELQAESVSYIVLKHYGIPVSHHPTYITLWKGNSDAIKKHSNVIAKTSRHIINQIDKEAEKEFK